jgi:MerR family transcriptional regulator, light-induced transcriptional regulator
MTRDLSRQLDEKARAITDDVIATDYARRPELLARYGERGRSFYRRDNEYHLSFLAEAVASDEPRLFIDYVGWAKSMLSAHGVVAADLAENLVVLRDAIRRHVPTDAAAAAGASIDASLQQLPVLPEEPPTFCSPTLPNGRLAEHYLSRLLAADRRGAAALIHDAVDAGVPLKRIYLDVFQQSQREVGRLWQLSRITVAQEHYCTAATQVIMNQFFPLILDAPRIGRRVIALCVEGDLHEIGLRIVADLFELAGWDCDFIGANTPTESVLDSLGKHPVDLVILSATMTYHVKLVEEFIRKLRARPDTRHVPVLVGGRPFLIAEKLWQRVGADGWAADADTAVAKGTELVDRH